MCKKQSNSCAIFVSSNKSTLITIVFQGKLDYFNHGDKKKFLSVITYHYPD